MPLAIVEQYNPEWPKQFDDIKAQLASYLTGVEVESIEHVGSTAVPGLAAKNVIDIDIIVKRENVESAIAALEEKGKLVYLGEQRIKDRHALRSPIQTPPRNIYVVVEGCFQLRNHLGVRDTLRADAALRDEYGRFTIRLAEQGLEIIDYVAAKSEILQKILRKAGMSEEELDAINAANMKGDRYPGVKTERLLLREFVMKDVEGFFEIESRPEVVRYQAFEPRTRSEVQKEVVAILRNAADVPRNHIELAVIHEGELIGRVGASIKREDEDGEELPVLEANLWFSFSPESHGRGFATEAMRAFIPLLGSPRKLEIECDPRNQGSRKLAIRLGFSEISVVENAFEIKGEWVGSAVYQKHV